MKRGYSTDLSDADWERLEFYCSGPQRPRTTENSHHPRDPQHHLLLRLEERLRIHWAKNAHPSAGIVDSQSAKTAGVGGEHRGYSGGKKIRIRKRHLLVDTEGLVLKAKVHSAKAPDQDSLKLLLDSARTVVSGLKLMPPRGFVVLPKRWAVKCTFSWLDQNRRMSLGTARGSVRNG